MCIKKTAFLLGSGASYGHLPNENNKTPPIMKNFFSESFIQGILNEQEFPPLIKYFCSHTQLSDPLKAIKSIEKGSNLEKILGEISDGWLLHVAFFYIIRYLGTFCNNQISSDSAYVKLAQFIKRNLKDISGIINLNYDTLLDQAFIDKGILINYGFPPIPQKIFNNVKYIKPHGSLNFRVPYRLVNMQCQSWQEYLRQRHATILTNTIGGVPIERYDPSYDFEKDFLKDGILSYAPAMVMPIGNSKHYNQYDSYDAMWTEIENIFSTTTELIIIGCALNKEDEMLWEHIKKLNKKLKIKIISSNFEAARKISSEFKNRGFKYTTPFKAKGFYDYAYKYLL